MTLISQERAILFADVSGSTALYERLGDKPAAKAIEACLEELRGVVARHNGKVVKTIGDELMVVFDRPGLACVAAKEMQQRVSALPPAAGVKLAMIAPALVDGKQLSHPDLERAWRSFIEHDVTPVFHVADQPRHGNQARQDDHRLEQVRHRHRPHAPPDGVADHERRADDDAGLQVDRAAGQH